MYTLREEIPFTLGKDQKSTVVCFRPRERGLLLEVSIDFHETIAKIVEMRAGNLAFKRTPVHLTPVLDLTVRIERMSTMRNPLLGTLTVAFRPRRG